jgi:sugar phosphate isomerase/epimerase
MVHLPQKYTGLAITTHLDKLQIDSMGEFVHPGEQEKLVKYDYLKGSKMTVPIAVQLYSVRQYTEQDFSGTIRKIAAMGYAGVETAGFPGTNAQAAGALFKELGLAVSSAHTSLPVGKDQNRILDEMAAIGCKRLVCPGVSTSLFESMDGLKKAAHQLNEANEVCRVNGLTLGYHNHYKEFQIVEGQTAFDILTSLASPDVFFQIDTYWAHVAGIDVPVLVKKLGKRAPLLHMKDGPGLKDEPMVAVGDGIMNVPAILDAARGFCEWQIVELDSCATDMLAAVEKSYRYLASLKFE